MFEPRESDTPQSKEIRKLKAALNLARALCAEEPDEFRKLELILQIKHLEFKLQNAQEGIYG